MDRARLERQMREIALEHAAARLDDAEYLTRMARLRGELEIVRAHQARVLSGASRDGVARRPRRDLAARPGGRETDLSRAASRLDAPALELADRLEQQLRADREQLTHVRGIKMRSVVVH